MPEVITQDGEIVETGVPLSPEQMSLAVSLTKAEIDQQVATAKTYPRSIARVTQNILSLVTIDEEAAKECNYALPRGGKPITGPSIRLAEIVAGQWGNNRNGARVLHVDRAEKYVEAEGVFLDLETNTATTARVRRRIVDSKGRLYNDDMIIVTGNAACSIAKRNAILGGVPKAVWRKAHEAALATIKGDIKTLSERRDAAMKAFAAFGVKPEQIFAALQIGGVDDITLETMPTLIGMHAALKSGEETVESMFGNGGAGQQGGGDKKDLKGKLNDVANGGKPDDGKKAAGKGKEGDDKKSEADTGAKGKADAGEAKGKPQGDQTDASDDQPNDQPQAGGSDAPGASDSQDDDGFPGDPTGDEIERAKDRGAEAYYRGMSRKAVPKEYVNVPALSDAWLSSYDGTKEQEENDGSDKSQ